MPFAYYERLSRADQAKYRKSAAKVSVPLPDASALKQLVDDVERALAADDRKRVQTATAALVAAALTQLQAPPVSVNVLATRPTEEDGSELHGLYTSEEGERPLLRVWMRTAAHKKPVALRTFVRTVLHEIVHHLDFTIHDLEPSFHTEGFYARENDLARQILGPRVARSTSTTRRSSTSKQLDLLPRC